MKYFYLILILMFLSCKKKVEKPVSLRNQIEELMLLKNYKILSKKKINDSIEFYKAENKYFTINGNFNIKKNKKTDWWTVKKKNGLQILKIEYIIFDKKLFENQIVFYNEKTKIDTLYSKFYSFKKNGQILKFYFHTPKNESHNFSYANFRYSLLNDNGIVKTDSVNLKNGNGSYSCNIALGTSKKIAGFFSAFSSTDSRGDSLTLGNNTIYTFVDNVANF